MLGRIALLLVLCLLVPAVPLAAAADDPFLSAYNETVAALGGSAAGSLGGADVAVGNGTSCFNPPVCASPRQFQFGAASSINGGGAGGVFSQTMTINGQRGTFRAHVVCVTANGNTATFGGPIFHSTFVGVPQTEVGDNAFITVYDNGRAGDPAPDAVSFVFLDEPLPEAEGQCLVPPAPPMFPVVDGDIRVRDGQAPSGA